MKANEKEWCFRENQKRVMGGFNEMLDEMSRSLIIKKEVAKRRKDEDWEGKYQQLLLMQPIRPTTFPENRNPMKIIHPAYFPTKEKFFLALYEGRVNGDYKTSIKISPSFHQKGWYEFVEKDEEIKSLIRLCDLQDKLEKETNNVTA